VTWSGAQLRCAIQSRAIEQYEMLRAAALGATLPPQARSGLSILLHCGMLAWTRAISNAPRRHPHTAVPSAASQFDADRTSERHTVIQLLVAMAMAVPARRKSA